MLFTSLTFLYFHLLVIALRWALPRSWAEPLLLVASYVFYVSYGLQYGLLLATLTVFSYGAALLVERYPARRKLVLATSITVLLAVLCGFKYVAFVLSQVTGLLALPSLPFHPALPLGISFFTFEMISYLVDVSRHAGGDRERGAAAEPSLVRYALYIAYYPHLVAGPIVRASELLPHLRARPGFDAEKMSEGIFLILVGVAKKIVLADNMSPFVDAVFAQPSAYGTFGVWVGVLAYTGQIFCDFSGYTDIARGASLTLGYPLPENFDYPYLSTSITEFWRRWHMTLSRWLRDYLYIPLGGSRRGAARQYVNLLITMVIGGIWHGANWTFLAWGALHGVLLALHKGWDTLVSRSKRAEWVRSTFPYRTGALIATLFVVIIGWVLFRAPSFDIARHVIARMFLRVPGLGGVLEVTPDERKALLALGALVFVHALGANKAVLSAHRTAPPEVRGLYWAALCAIVFFFAQARAAFIYFAF